MAMMETKKDEENKKHKDQDVEDKKTHKDKDTEDDEKQRDRDEEDRTHRQIEWT